MQRNRSGGVSVIGLGKLGACVAASFASKGFDVVGVDVRPEPVEAINASRAPLFEPGLDEMIRENAERLRATTSYVDAIEASAATFIVVPTPSTAEGAFSLRYAVGAAREIGQALKTKDAYHLVVLTSTVMPGSTAGAIIPILEEESGKRCGPDFGVCYSPEFIALGSVIHDFLHPDFILIGESDSRAGDLLATYYEAVIPQGTPIARMTLAEAELTKLAVNSYVTAKITFANLLAAICEKLPGANVDVVSMGLGLDSRIGRKYLTGAVGYGGPCFPRDNLALSYLARTLGVDASIVEATDLSNRRQADRIADFCTARLRPGARVALMGLAYKPNTPVTDESPGVALARSLTRAGFEVVGYDPLVRTVPEEPCSHSFRVADTAKEALQGACTIILANADPAFETQEFLEDAIAAHPQLVVDCWRRWQSQMGRFHAADYVAVGISPADADLAQAGIELRELIAQTLDGRP